MHPKQMIEDLCTLETAIQRLASSVQMYYLMTNPAYENCTKTFTPWPEHSPSLQVALAGRAPLTYRLTPESAF